MLKISVAVFVFALTYYATAAIQAIFHRLFGHTKRYMPIYRNHADGHHGAYAGKPLLQEMWISSERHVLWYFAVPLTLLASAVYAATSVVVFASHLTAIGFSVVWHIGLHHHYHVSGSFLERYAWFQKKRALHFVHHRHVHSNYAISEYWLDRMMGTYRLPTPL